MPAACNACGTRLVRAEARLTTGGPNKRGCPSQGIEWLFHFAGRGAMDIEHLGYMTVMRLLEKGLIEDPADIYALDAEKLRSCLGSRTRPSRTCSSRSRPRRIGRSGGCWWGSTSARGDARAQVLARAFRSIDALAEASEDQIDDVPEIGPEIAATVREWFDEEENLQLIEKLRAAGLRLADETRAEAETTRTLDGVTLVLTGGLEMLSREEATELAQAAGARVSSSVSKKTSFVVVGENRAPSSRRPSRSASR